MIPTLAGIFVAAWTPTNAAGELVEDALIANLRFALGHGVHGVMAVGSTGEFPLLPVDVRQRALELIVSEADPRPVIANVSDINPRNAILLGRAARKAGAATISLLPPSFFELRQADVCEFFIRVASESGIPVVLYNFPERTGNSITVETIVKVADRGLLAGVKHSGSNFEFLRLIVELGRERHFAVFTGADTRLAEAMELGVSGCVSGLANAVPDLITPIFNASPAARQDAKIEIARMHQLGHKMDQLPFPLNVAAAIQARGLEPGEFKQVISDATRRDWSVSCNELKQLFAEWNLG